MFISHVYPDADSQLAHILSWNTEMPVVMVPQNIEVRANTAYVIAPNTDLRMDGNMLVASSPATRNEQVDIFFTSLAESYGRRAIGLIFSGHDGDGTLDASK